MRNPFNPLRVYVLALEDDCWYVGLTPDLSARVISHFVKPSVSWVKLHKPIGLARVFYDGSSYLETTITLDLIKLYGLAKVRGGAYTAAVLADTYARKRIAAHIPTIIKEFL